MPDDRRSAREHHDDALVGRFIASVRPGGLWRRLPRGDDPPDYIVDAAGGRIGIELTEVQPEHVPDGVTVTVTGPWRESQAKRSNKALHQHSVQRQILDAAEAQYKGRRRTCVHRGIRGRALAIRISRNCRRPLPPSLVRELAEHRLAG